MYIDTLKVIFIMERIWTKHYPSGVPANIPDLEDDSLVSLFDRCLDKYRKKTAFSCMGRDISYGDLNKYAEKFGAYLQSRGLKQGDRFAIMLPNLIQYPVALIGAIRVGLVIVNVNPLYTPREIEHQLKDSGAKGILIAENFLHNLEKAKQELNLDVIISTSIGEFLNPIKGMAVDFVLKNVKRIIPKHSLTNVIGMKKALAHGKSYSLQKASPTLEDMVALQYTGGTTGVSKGAILTHKNILSNLKQMDSFWGDTLSEGKETIVTALPMYHIFGFTVNFISTFVIGAHNILIPNARDLDTVINAFKKYPVSLFTGVNTLFQAMTAHKEFDSSLCTHLKLNCAGGMALQKSVADDWKKKTGTTILQGYGLTESSPATSFNPPKGLVKDGTVGIPLPSCDIKIVNDQGVELGIGEIGELCLSGPHIMKGYYNKPEETANTLRNGWLHTGDIATVDEDGYIKIVDRKKDMILVSGFNVFPNELEDIIVLHPKVAEAAVVGVRDDKSGEVVKAFIVKKEKSLTKDELIQYCRENMTGYKVPKHIEFRDELPKTNVGKILRRALKE